MPDFGMAFDQLVDTDTAVTAAVAFGGYMVPFVVSNLTSRVGFDTPDELDGILVFALVAAMRDTVPKPNAAGAGALVYAGEAGAERVGIKSTIAEVGS